MKDIGFKAHLRPKKEPKEKRPRPAKTTVHLDANIGIYAIVLEQKKRAYIGQSKNIPSRLRAHKLSLNRGSYKDNSKGLQELQADYNTYGESAFKFIKIHECDKDDLFSCETHFCKQYTDEGYELYNFFTHTDTAGLACPREFLDVVIKVVKLLDSGKLRKGQLEAAIEQIETSY